VAPGKTARFRTSIHSGDVLSGGMFFHLQEGGEEPGEWPVFRFDGSSVVDTPITYGQDKNDPEALAVRAVGKQQPTDQADQPDWADPVAHWKAYARWLEHANPAVSAVKYSPVHVPAEELAAGRGQTREK